MPRRWQLEVGWCKRSTERLDRARSFSRAEEWAAARAWKAGYQASYSGEDEWEDGLGECHDAFRSV